MPDAFPISIDRGFAPNPTSASPIENQPGHNGRAGFTANILFRITAGYDPKSSNIMFSGGTPRSSSILSTADIIIGGPQR